MQERMVIEGGHQLVGSVRVSGGKNTSVAIIPATILSDTPCTVENLPNIEDVAVSYETLLYLGAKVDWKPEAVFDDGTKTYIRMPSRFSETPAFYIILDKKETMTNFRVKGRYYIVDRLFDKAYLKIGAKKVVITRKDKLIDSNIRENREANRLRTATRGRR